MVGGLRGIARWCASATRRRDRFQLDVYGELLDTLYVARKAGLRSNAQSWSLECGLVQHLEKIWISRTMASGKSAAAEGISPTPR